MKIQVKVKPNSKHQTIEQSEEGTWIVRLKSPPVEGKANKELIELLAKNFKVPQKQITIKAGLFAKNKLVEIEE